MSTKHIALTRPTASHSHVRRRLLSSGAVTACACALLLAPASLRAQQTGVFPGMIAAVAPEPQVVVIPEGAFEGIPDVVVPGSATIVRVGTTDQITINASEAIINWTPNDRTGTGSIDFLPNGRSAFFSGPQDFTVLNRIIPLDGNDLPIARLIELNGLVQSSITDPLTGQAGPGGNVWFYSPGGILVGGGAAINVGSLVLTSRDIDTTGGLFGSGGEIRFRDPGITGTDTAGISIADTAQITAIQAVAGSAYIAMVAPRIVQAGTVNADGSIALVAAEAADIRINQGLFDINVLVGTGDSNGVVHTGNTGGPSETNPGYSNRVYMVAVPKNQALTMLLSGTVGFETAQSVTVDANGGIVLSAGRNIVGGEIADRAPAAIASTASMRFSGGRFINSLTATATHDITVRPDSQCFSTCASGGPGTIRFGNDVSLSGERSVTLAAEALQLVQIGGELNARSALPGTGGTISVTANAGGVVSVAERINLDASATGITGFANGVATGGSVVLGASNGGQISASSIELHANALGGTNAVGDGANATGGNVRVGVASGGILRTSSLLLTANGTGGLGGTNGGNGTGGSTRLEVDGSTLSLSSVQLDSNGRGGLGPARSGNGTGGTANVTANTSAELAFGSAFVNANGFGGSVSPFGNDRTLIGGDGFGGSASIDIGSSSLPNGHSLGFTLISAVGRGGTAIDPTAASGVRGGDGTGGAAGLSMTSGLATVSQLIIASEGSGGDGFGTNSQGGIGGNGRGGVSQLALNIFGATLDVTGGATITAQGVGGVGQAESGDGHGGTATVDVTGGNELNLAGGLRVIAAGIGGGAGFSQSTQVNTVIGGDGTGGTARVTVSGLITTPDMTIDASGEGGGAYSSTSPATGGDGSGGLARLTVDTFLTPLDLQQVSLFANGTGGSSGLSTGTAGFGLGGQADLIFTATSFTVDALTIAANGLADTSGGGADLGASGGSVNILGFVGSLTATLFNVESTARVVGQSTASRTSGVYRGGSIILETNEGATVSSDQYRFDAGAYGASATETGGDAIGGSIVLRANAGSSIISTGSSPYTASFDLRAEGLGGEGTVGGNAVGGTISLVAQGGSITGLQSIGRLQANGIGGAYDGGTREDAFAIGGRITISLTSEPGSAITINSLFAIAQGSAGYLAGNAIGRGGFIEFNNNGGTYTGSGLYLSADGRAETTGDGRGGDIRFAQSAGIYNVGFTSISADGSGGYGLPGAKGGTGFGGRIEFLFDGGTIGGLNFFAQANGFGSSGGSTAFDAGGAGGGAIVGGPTGQPATVGTKAGNGGDGYGGVITSIIADGTISLSSMSFDASGYGGRGGGIFLNASPDGITGDGGYGRGGDIRIDAIGGTLDGTALFLSVNGRGGDGGGANGDFFTANPPDPTGVTETASRAGDGQGGFAQVRLAGTVGGRYAIDSSATGGEGGSGFAGFAGGQGYGGTSELLIDNYDAGTVDVSLRSNGYGGRGSRGLQGKGGRGGQGFGGVARVVAQGLGASVGIDGSNINVNGFGGDGGFGSQVLGTPIGFDGGDGGDGFGGSIELTAFDNAELVLNTINGEGVLQSVGYGGGAGNGSFNNFGPIDVARTGGNAGFGGVGQGGSILLLANSGTITNGGDQLSIETFGVGGEGGFGGQGNQISTTDPITGIVTFTGGDGYSTGDTNFTIAGTIRLEALSSEVGDGLLSLGDVELYANGTWAGRVELTDRAKGAGLAFGSLYVEATGFDPYFGGPSAGADSGIHILSRDGAITVERNALFTTSTEFGEAGGRFFIDAAADSEGGITGGLTVGGTFSFLGARIGGVHGGNRDIDHEFATISAGSINIEASGTIDFAPTTLLASDSFLTLFNAYPGSTSGINFGGLRADFDVVIETFGVINGQQIISNDFLDIDAAGDINLLDVQASGAIIQSSGALKIATLLTTDDGAELLAGGLLSVDEGTVGRTLNATSTGGSIILGNLTSGGSASLNADGNITIASLTVLGDAGNGEGPIPGAINLTAGGNVGLGQLDAVDGITIEAGTLTGAESSLSAFGDVLVTVTGDLQLGSVDAAGVSITAGGTLRFASILADRATVRSAGTLTGGSIVTNGGDASLTSTGADVLLDGGDIAGAFTVSAFRDVVLGTFVSDFDADIAAGRDARITSIVTEGTDQSEELRGISSFAGSTGGPSAQAGGATSSNIIITVAGELNLGNLDSLGDITIDAGRLTGATSTLQSNGQTRISTTSDAQFGTLNADTAVLDIGTLLNFTSTTTGGFTTIFADSVDGNSVTSTGDIVQITAGSGGIRIGTLNAFGGAALLSAGVIDLTSLISSEGGVLLSAAGDVTVDEGDVRYRLSIDTGNSADLGTVTAGQADVTADGLITISSLTTTGVTGGAGLPGQDLGGQAAPVEGGIALTSASVITLGSLNSATDIDIDGFALTGTASSLRAADAISISTDGGAIFGTLDAASANINSGALVFTRSTTSGSTTINSSGHVTGGDLQATNGSLLVTTTAGSNVVIDTVNAGFGVTINSAGLIDIGSLTSSFGGALIDAADNITIDTADIGGQFSVDSDRNVTIGTADSTGSTIVRAGGDISAASLTTTAGPSNSSSGGALIRLTAGGNVGLGSLNSADSITINSATLTSPTSSLRAVGSVSITTTGAATFGTLDAASADITSGALTFTRSTTSGSTTINSSGHVAGGELRAVNGSLLVTTTALGNVVIDTVNAGFGVTINSAGLIDLGSLTSSFGGALIDAAGNITVDTANIGGQFSVDGDRNVTIGTASSAGSTIVRAGGDITAASLTTTAGLSNSSAGGALIRLTAGGNVGLGSLNSADSITISSATLTSPTSSLRAVGSVSITTTGAATFGTLDAASAIISAGAPLSFTRVTTSGDASLSSTGTIAGSLIETSNSGAVINATGTAIDVATINGAGDVRLSATSGALRVNALASAGLVSAIGGTVTIGGSSNLDFSNLRATAGDAAVSLSSGALRVRQGNATGTLTLTTLGGSLTLDTASAASIALRSSSTATISQNATATGTLTVTSTGAAIINGIASGQTVRITSGDIVIGSNGRLGTGGTTALVDLTNGNGAARTFIGGGDVATGYSLSASELTRIFGGDITIHAPRTQSQGGTSLGSSRPPDVVIDAFTLNGGASTTGNLGPNGTFTIDTPGAARVIGAVQFNGMTASNGFLLSADDAIEVILGQGSIRLSNGTALSGRLILQSEDIAVATSDAISDIADATSIEQIDARLALNDGVLSEEGALAAGSISFSILNGLFIQNSGASDSFDARRGFTANSVSINTESGTNSIVINGRVADDLGVLRTGIDAIGLVQVNGIPSNAHTVNGGGFHPGSTINGCVIVQASTCSVDFVLPPTQDVIDHVVDPDDESDVGYSGESNAFNIVIDLREIEPLPNEPLIDDPVTGTGNDDLWLAPEE